MGCFSPLILEKLGSKPGRGGHVLFILFLLGKIGSFKGK